MKQHYSLLVLLLVFLSSCVVIVDSTNANFQDELYYSSEEYALEDAKDEVAYQQYLKENEVEEEALHTKKNCMKNSLIMRTVTIIITHRV